MEYAAPHIHDAANKYVEDRLDARLLFVVIRLLRKWTFYFKRESCRAETIENFLVMASFALTNQYLLPSLVSSSEKTSFEDVIGVPFFIDPI